MAPGTRGDGPARLAKLYRAEPTLAEQCLRTQEARLPVRKVRQKADYRRKFLCPGTARAVGASESESRSDSWTRESKGSAGCSSSPGPVAPPPVWPRPQCGHATSRPRLQRGLGVGGAWGRRRPATRARSYGNARDPANRDVRVRPCRPITGRAGGWRPGVAPGIWSCQRGGASSGGCGAGKATGGRGQGSGGRAAVPGRARGGSRWAARAGGA